MAAIKRHEYDVEKYDFTSIIKSLFDCKDLSEIHKTLPQEITYNELHKIGEDNKTWFHKRFYAPINEGNSTFQSLYEQFIEDEIYKYVDERDFLYQKTPTFRVHAPGNVAVGGWHKDSDYNHPLGEINFIVPLTRAYGANTVWSESSPGLKDFSPINMELGEIIEFDGNQCQHGNKVNRTGVSRVSFDFRILPLSKYKPDTSLKSISANRQFILGDYYKMHTNEG